MAGVSSAPGLARSLPAQSRGPSLALHGALRTGRILCTLRTGTGSTLFDSRLSEESPDP